MIELRTDSEVVHLKSLKPDETSIYTGRTVDPHQSTDSRTDILYLSPLHTWRSNTESPPQFPRRREKREETRHYSSFTVGRTLYVNPYLLGALSSSDPVLSYPGGMYETDESSPDTTLSFNSKIVQYGDIKTQRHCLWLDKYWLYRWKAKPWGPFGSNHLFAIPDE